MMNDDWNEWKSLANTYLYVHDANGIEAITKKIQGLSTQHKTTHVIIKCTEITS